MEKADIIAHVESTFGEGTPLDYDSDAIFEWRDQSTDAFLSMIRGHDWHSYLRLLETPGNYKARGLSDAIAYMTPVALHYFAPAILIFSFSPKADDLPDLFFSMLYVSGVSQSLGAWQQRRIDQFTVVEKIVVACAVEAYYGDGSDPTQRAQDILEYWRPYLNNVDRLLLG